MLSKHGFGTSGKIKDDFRMTRWAKIFRKYWLDELPMLINLIKGDVKLVGVRPLSKHYLSLYSEELIQKRFKQYIIKQEKTSNNNLQIGLGVIATGILGNESLLTKKNLN